ncbi:MAG: hypothetical protein ABIY70_15450 [Capsulimonas sp.]|uniref:hypothetical protein n=1 Tax=Capsulimonas sp. TaxID=2494211 RepID=UPI003266E705
MAPISRYFSPLTAALAVSALLPICPCALLTPAAAQSAPDGWQTTRSGADRVFTPPDVPDGEYFTMTVKPAASLASDSLRSWMADQMDADSARLGTVASPGSITENTKGRFYLCTRGIRTPSGISRVVAYMAVRRPGGKAQLIRVLTSPKREIYMAYMKPSLKLVMGLSGADSSRVAHDTPSDSGGGSGSSKPRPLSRMAQNRLQYTTKPGAGVKSSQMEGVFIYQTMEGGVGGYMYVAYEPLLALKDGTYYEDLDVPPADFNVAAARRLRPKAWGRWRRVGGAYQTYSEKGGWEKEHWIRSGAGTGLKLSGYYSHLGGGGDTAYGGSTVISYVNEFTFHSNGRFEGGGSSGLSSPNITVGSERKSPGGTYQIDGYTITMRFNDGHVERRSFALADPKKTDMIYLNGTSFLLKD